jgi:uncharacterized alpha-E superfamily protein
MARCADEGRRERGLLLAINVMSGGYARIGRSEDAAAIAMQRGGSVADVWIMSDAKVDSTSMLPPPAAPYTRAEPAMLPSRAADNLFWLGRYVERAEGVMRLMRAYHIRLAETAEPSAPLLRHVRDHLHFFDVDPAEGVPEQLRSTLTSAIGSASRVRDRFSIDGWMAINDLAKTSHRMAETVQPGDDAASAMSVLLRKITGFSGLVHDNMYRSMGWRFLSIGRSLERAMMMASALAHFCEPDAPDGSLDLVVEFGDSEMSYRQRYAVATGRRTVIDLLACDDQNPRSIVHHLEELRDHIDTLPGANGQNSHSSPAARMARLAHAELFAREPDTLNADGLLAVRGGLLELSDLLSAAYLS